MSESCQHGISLWEDWCSQCGGAPGSSKDKTKSEIVKEHCEANNIPYTDLPMAKVHHSHDATVCHHGNPIAEACEPCEDECERLNQQEWNDYDSRHDCDD